MKEWLDNFAQKHPKAAQWIREGGLFLIFSYVVTFLKWALLTFLPGLVHIDHSAAVFELAAASFLLSH